MKFLKKILFGTEEQGSYKMKYSKSNNEWHVTLNESIVYIGEKDKCELYLQNVKSL